MTVADILIIIGISIIVIFAIGSIAHYVYTELEYRRWRDGE